MRTTGVNHFSPTGLIRHLSELFMTERLREATQFWSFPCPVEMGGELLVMHDSQALEAFLRRRREQAREAGLLAMTPRVVAIEVPRKDGRFRIWLRWIYGFASRSEEDPDLSVYYMLRRPSGELRIEMMTLVRIGTEALSA